MSYRSYYTRGFSLPEQFCIEHAKNLVDANDETSVLASFDNNRYVSRKRINITTLENFESVLLGHKVTIKLKAMWHISNNLVIVASIHSQDDLSAAEIRRLNDNWIPTENIFEYGADAIHIRNILNYGFGAFLAKARQKKFSLKTFFSLPTEQTFRYQDKDIQEIEKIYHHFGIKYDDFFIVPTMYGNSSVFVGDAQSHALQYQELSLDKKPLFVLENQDSFLVQRNFAYIFRSTDIDEKYIYLFAFFNLLKHIKNRLNSEISVMMDSLVDQENDYSLYLQKATEIKKEYSIHYDEFNNINIWHDNALFDLSKFVRSEQGWNLEHELVESKNKLDEFIELTTEMSKGKLQGFMDSISILIGILGIFAIFDLVQVLTQEPYKIVPWYVAFVIIIILLPFLFIIIAKKSNAVLRFINRYL